MLRVLLVLVLSAVAVAVTASAAVRLVSDEPVGTSTTVTGLPWAERVFTSKREFAAFLASRGASYKTWAARHPGAAPWLPKEARARLAAQSKGAPSGATAAGRPVGTATGVEPAASGGGGGGWRLASAALSLTIVPLLLVILRLLREQRTPVVVAAVGPAFDRPHGWPTPSPVVQSVASALAAVPYLPAQASSSGAATAEPAPSPASDPPRGWPTPSPLARSVASALAAGPSPAAQASSSGAGTAEAPAPGPARRARLLGGGVPLVAWLIRAASLLARRTASGLGTVRRFSREHDFNPLDATTYSLAIASAAGVGLLIAYLAAQ